MLGLLNPLALWLAPLLAAPLLIHFLGRVPPVPRDFPSLMAVQGRLTRAMRRHRLKNWLQLVLRTLALLCLLLAAASPVWHARGFAPPRAAGVLLHNGAYAGLPLPQGGTEGERAEALRKGLDSLTGGEAFAEKLFPEAGRGNAARFGRYDEVVARLLRRAEGAPSFHLYLPVFDGRDLAEIRAPLQRWLETHPGARLVLLDYTEDAARLTPFAGSALGFPREDAALLRVRTASASAPLWTPRDGSPRDASLKNDSAEILLPLPDSGWMAGELSLPAAEKDRYAYATEAFSFRVPPPATVCRVAPDRAQASHASLGRGGPRLNMASFGSGRELGSRNCEVLYLADPPDADADLLAKAAASVRRGGRLILQAGKNTDIALWNRALLAPLGMGRFSELKSSEPVPVVPQTRELAHSGFRAQAWGSPGSVQRRLGFQAAPGTVVLLSAGPDPILAQARAGAGEILLWTTDLDDPDWTDLGLGPWPALLHPGFLERGGASGVQPLRVDSDSSFVFPASEDADLEVFDPAGKRLEAPRREPGGWRLGPFDRLGLYRLESGRDTSWLAVGLAEERMRSAGALSPGDFRASLSAEARRRTAVLAAGADWKSLYGGKSLRLFLLILAALLLFAEGLVSLRLAPSRE